MNTGSIERSVIGRRLPEVILKPVSGMAFPDLREVWNSRNLLVALALADIKARYRQTVMGLGWNLLQPFMAMLVFTFIFGNLGAFSSDGRPYAMFFFAGFLIWQFFYKAVALAVPSLASNAHLIAKVYFPRLVIILFPILTALAEFLFSSVILAGLYVWYGYLPSVAIATLPLFVLFAGLAALAISLWLAPLNVYFRDVQYALASLLQFGFFLTPVVYAPSTISETWRWLVYLNPMAAIVEGARWSLVGSPPPPVYGIALSLGIITILLVAGSIFFQRTTLTIVDRL